MALLVLGGCATGRPPSGSLLAGDDAALDTGGGGPAPMPLPVVQGGLVILDGFETLLRRAGLGDCHLLPTSEAGFTPEDAAELYDALLVSPVSLANFGPRLAASSLLREVMEGEEELSRPALLARVQRFEGLAVLRPDGYVAWALNGETQQRVGPVSLKDGALRAGPFEVGRFYDGRSGAFFPVDEVLQRVRTEIVKACVGLR